jgi:hypothetical protein
MAETPEAAELINAMRQGDDVATRKLYQKVFANPLGRAVLMHILADSGLGVLRGSAMPNDVRAYEDGRQDAALEIMQRAGFDQASAAVMVITDNLEGQEHDGDGHGSEPIVE